MNLFDELEQAAEMAASSAKKTIQPQSEEEEKSEQRSRDWFKARLGMFTASKMPDLMKRLKNGEMSEAAKSVILKVSIERTLTPEGIEIYVDEEMGKEFRQTRWGNKWEATARKALSERLCIVFNDVSFGKNQEVAFFGGSADGVSEDGKIVLEIKCPFDPVKHEKNRLIDEIDQKHEYYAQMQSHLLNYPDAEICIFASFDPRRKSPHDLAVHNVIRNEAYQAAIIAALNEAENIIKESYK